MNRKYSIIKKEVSSYSLLRWFTGGLILMHGLCRVFMISVYADFVVNTFERTYLAESVLTIGATLFPFLEFFTGLLIITGTQTKKAVRTGFAISLIMVLFILAGSLYTRLIYHTIVLSCLFVLHFGFLSPGSKNKII